MTLPPLPSPLLTLLRAAGAAVALGSLLACGEPQRVAEASEEDYPVRQVLVRYDKAPGLGSPDGKGDAKAPLWRGRTREQARKRAEEVRDRARAKGADFEAIAREASDELETKEDGGFVGFVSVWGGQTEPLVRAVASVPAGGVTEPVETEHGFHVIERLSREDGKAAEARLVPVLEGFVLPWHMAGSTLDASITKESAYAAAAHALEEIRGGKDPGLLVGHLEGPIPVREAYRRPLPGGDDRLWKAAVDLKPGGEWSDPIETSLGWAVVKRVPHVRCYVRHLVVSHRLAPVDHPPARTPPEALARAEEALAKVKEDRGRWNEVVREYSDEPASAGRGGFMGDVSNAEPLRRRALPEFEEAIFALKPGDLSGVVETRFGFHVFWRVD